MFISTYRSFPSPVLDARGANHYTLLLSRILISLYDFSELSMQYGLGHQVYQDIYLDLCEMLCHVAVDRHKLPIDLEPELSVEVALCPRI